jgi:hypothetical protein
MTRCIGDMTDRPLVSALMLTTHPRRGAFVRDALASFRLQTYPATELVVVNDGRPMRAAGPRQRVVQVPPGLPLGAKRNVGLGAARGEFVAMWDDDDFSLPERLAQQVKLARATGADYVRSTVIWLADEDLRVVRMFHDFCYCTAMMRRTAALRCGGFPEIDLAEDAGLFQRMAAVGLRWAFRDFAWYVHRRHRSNVSRLLDGTTLEELGRKSGVIVRRSQRDIDALNRRIPRLRRGRPAPAAPAGRLPADLRGVLRPPVYALARGFSLQRVRRSRDGFLAAIGSPDGRQRQVRVSPAAVPACEWLIERAHEPFMVVDAVVGCDLKPVVIRNLLAGLDRAGALRCSSDGRRSDFLYRGHPYNRGAPRPGPSRGP